MRAGRQLDRALGEGAEAQLWPLQIGQDADRAPGIASRPAGSSSNAGAVIVLRAMAEIEAEHVDAGIEQRADALVGRAGGPEGRDDLCAASAPHVDLPAG